MRLKYSHFATILLVWGAIELVRVSTDRDELREQLDEPRSARAETGRSGDGVQPVQSPSSDESIVQTVSSRSNAPAEPLSLRNDQVPVPRLGGSSASIRAVAPTPAWTASEWAAHIKKIAPQNVTLKSVEATDDYAELIGEAHATRDVAMLMRAIEQAGFGMPKLQQAVRNGDAFEFNLIVRVGPPASILSSAH